MSNFNIRVYAIILNEKKDAILVSDEFQKRMRITKFPGGGLEFGEGTLDCLHRESMEEFGQDIEILKHFYTTEYFQKSMFHEDTQLISIYYLATFKENPKFEISEIPFDYGSDENGKQSFRWAKLEQITADTFTLPVDKIVAGMLTKPDAGHQIPVNL